MSVVNHRGQQAPCFPRGEEPIGFASRPRCTGPAMGLQTTVDHSLIRGLVTRIDRCSSGGFPMSRARASIDIGHLLLAGVPPTVTSPPALCTLCCCFGLSSSDSFNTWPLRRAATLDDVSPDVCIHHLAAYFGLGRAERSIPEARQGRASWREGLTAKARAKRQSDCHDEGIGSISEAGLGRNLLTNRPQEGSELAGDRRCHNRGLLALRN